jgi:hypothetical protein
VPFDDATSARSVQPQQRARVSVQSACAHEQVVQIVFDAHAAHILLHLGARVLHRQPLREPDECESPIGPAPADLVS